MTDPHDQRHDRRKSTLTDDDIGRIEDAFDRRQTALFEIIGYDVASASSRREIREDHEFVRDLRKVKGRILWTFFASIGASASAWLYNLLAGRPHP